MIPRPRRGVRLPRVAALGLAAAVGLLSFQGTPPLAVPQSKPASASELHSQAEAMLAKGQTEQALGLLQQAVAADPGYWPSLCRMGEILLAGGRAAQAEPLLKQATEINPGHGPCLSRYAQSLLMGGKSKEAEAPLLRAAELMPADAGVQFNLARLYETTERPVQAIEAYRRFLSGGGDPKRNASARLKLARLLGEEHRLDDAIIEYRAYLKETPERQEVRNELATVLAAASRYTEALAEYEQLFAAGGGDADGLARAGEICRLNRDLPRAIDFLDRAVKKDPKLVPARLSLGTALAQAGDHGRAVEVFQSVAADEPENERVHHLLGQSLMKLGRTEEARQALDRHRQLHEKILKQRMSGQPQGAP